MPRTRTIRVVVGIAVSFAGLTGAIVYLSRLSIISVAMAKLMLVALVGLYIGIGILIAAYRLLGKLE